MLKQKIPFSFCVLFCALHPDPTSAQSLPVVTSTVNLTLADSSIISLRNLSFDNQASFTAPSSTLVIDSSDPQHPVHIGGVGELSLHTLQLKGKKSAGLVLTSDLAISGSLQLEEGILNLNEHSIYLGSEQGKIEGESEKSYVSGEGSILKVVHLNQPDEQEPGQLGLRISSKKNLGRTLIKRTHKKNSVGSGNGVLRQFELFPEYNTDLNATVAIRYLDRELGGLEERALSIWEKENSDWEAIGIKKLNTQKNWAKIRNLESLNMLSLAIEEGAEEVVEEKVLDSNELSGNQVSAEESIPSQVLLTVYPNPTTDFLQLKLPQFAQGIYQLDLMAPNGSVAQSLQMQKTHSIRQINMTGMSVGTYVLRVQTPQQKVYSFEIVKL